MSKMHLKNLMRGTLNSLSDATPKAIDVYRNAFPKMQEFRILVGPGEEDRKPLFPISDITTDTACLPVRGI